ncbi:HrpJ domain-containing protein [Escherichia coli]
MKHYLEKLIKRLLKNSLIAALTPAALKAKLFGQALSLNPKLLRASYRQFLMAEDDAVDTYVE